MFGMHTLSLLEDHQAHLETLVVFHRGLQKDRFTAAVRAQNACIQLYGQEETQHYVISAYEHTKMLSEKVCCSSTLFL